MTEPKEITKLREELRDWIEAYKDAAERHALAETPDESADWIMSGILAANNCGVITKRTYDTDEIMKTRGFPLSVITMNWFIPITSEQP